MSWADSLGNATALDAWRAAIGLQYPSERTVPTVHTGLGAPTATACRTAGCPASTSRCPGW